jgi:hypothetical protein
LWEAALISPLLIIIPISPFANLSSILPTPTKQKKPQEHAPGIALSQLSVVAVLFSSRISRSIYANVFSSTRKCSTIRNQLLGIPCGTFQLCFSGAVYHAGGVCTLPCSHHPQAGILNVFTLCTKPHTLQHRNRRILCLDLHGLTGGQLLFACSVL